MRAFKGLWAWVVRSTQPELVPNFSSDLVRRIGLLRTVRGGSGRRTAVGVAAAMAIALVGAGTMALRGGAETAAAPKTDDTAGETAVAKAFGAQRPDLTYFDGREIGLAVVRPAELSRRTYLAPLVSLGEGLVQSEINGLSLVETSAPAVRFADIDYVAYSLRSTGTPDNMILGCDLAVSLKNEVDVVSWMVAHVPHMERVKEDGFTYAFNSDGEESVGRWYMAQRDAHTFVVSMDAEGLRRLAKAEPSQAAVKGFVGRTELVDGGVATVSLQLDKLESAIGLELNSSLDEFGVAFGAAGGDPNPAIVALRMLRENVRSISLGTDVDPTSGRLGLRMAFRCADADGAEKVRGVLQMFQGLFGQYLKLVYAEPKAHKADDARMQAHLDGFLELLKMVNDTKFELRERDGGIDVWAEMSGEIPGTVLGFGDEPVQFGMRSPASAQAENEEKAGGN